MLSTTESKEALKKGANRTLWFLIIGAVDKMRDKMERDAGRAWFASRRKPLMKQFEDNGVRVWAARTRAALEVWLGWLAAHLQSDDSEKYSCSLSNTGGRPVLS